MGKISIFVILTIFTFRNIVGEYGVWQTIETDNDNNSFFSSLVYLLIEDKTYNAETNYAAHMRKQLVDELRACEEEYENDPRLQQMTVEQYITDFLQEVTFGGPVGELELELISKLYKSEIVICDWTTKNIRIYRKGDGITQRLFFLYHSVNHYDPLYKNDRGTLTLTFPLGNETDKTRYDDILTVARDPDYFKNVATSSAGANKRQRK